MEKCWVADKNAFLDFMFGFDLGYPLVVDLCRIPIRRGKETIEAALINPSKAIVNLLDCLIVRDNKAQHNIAKVLVLGPCKALLVKGKKSLKPSWNFFNRQGQEVHSLIFLNFNEFLSSKLHSNSSPF